MSVNLPAMLGTKEPQKDPFDHWVFDGVWESSILLAAYREIITQINQWQKFDNENEFKFACSEWSQFGYVTQQILSIMKSEVFCNTLSEITGIPGLTASLFGGGAHVIRPKGHLGTHVDFNRGADGSYRRLNCLLYLNDDWTEEDGGHLELRKNAFDPEPTVSVLPTLNTMVLFRTSEHSWHGHPKPLPGPKPRVSLACYYYTDEPPESVAPAHTTIFAT